MDLKLNSKQIAVLLMEKIQDAKEGKNLVGAETMCQCVTTLIDLARLEMQYAHLRSEIPAIDYLSKGNAEANIPLVDKPMPALPVINVKPKGSGA